MYNRYSDPERRSDFGRNDPRSGREFSGSRYGGDESWRGYRSRQDDDYDVDDIYGARGDERDFQYDFERGSNRGYRGMSQREGSERFDELGGPQRYSSYPQWGRSSERFQGRSLRGFSSERYDPSTVGTRSTLGGQFVGRGPKGYRRSDERIQEEICERLTQHPDIDATDIEVKVKDGEVTLSGTVDQRYCKRMAEDLVDNVSGVRDVRNEIRVQQDAGSFMESSRRSEGVRGQQMMSGGKASQHETVSQRKH